MLICWRYERQRWARLPDQRNRIHSPCNKVSAYLSQIGQFVNQKSVILQLMSSRLTISNPELLLSHPLLMYLHEIENHILMAVGMRVCENAAVWHQIQEEKNKYKYFILKLRVVRRLPHSQFSCSNEDEYIKWLHMHARICHHTYEYRDLLNVTWWM